MNSLLIVLALITVCIAKPIHHPDHIAALSIDTRAIDHPATSPRSLRDSIRPHHTLSKRAPPWISLGSGWMATVVNFDPILASDIANRALQLLYTGVANHCLAGKLSGNTTPTNYVVLRIGDLQFIAESTAAMEWDVIFQFVIKMRDMVGLGTSSMYTAMFAHVAGHAMMFSIRVVGMDGQPID